MLSHNNTFLIKLTLLTPYTSARTKYRTIVPYSSMGEVTQNDQVRNKYPKMAGKLGPNGEQLGPDGQPLRDADGFLLGPNGERLGPNGEQLGPNGEILGPDGQPKLGPNGELLLAPDGR